MTLESDKLLVRLEGAANGGVESARGRLRLREVSVDVVGVDRLLLRCDARRLAGAEQSANESVAEVAPDRAARFESGVVRLHDHVEQR